jgi:hypothetical protein
MATACIDLPLRNALPQISTDLVHQQECIVPQVHSGASRFALYIIKQAHTLNDIRYQLRQIPKNAVLQVAFYNFMEGELLPFMKMLSQSKFEVRNMFFDHCKLAFDAMLHTLEVSVLQFQHCEIDISSELMLPRVKTIMEGESNRYSKGFFEFITHFPNMNNYVEGHIANSYINSIHYQHNCCLFISWPPKKDRDL